jgi:ATP-dependent Lhr-like helicase
MMSKEIAELTRKKGWQGLNPIQLKAYEEIQKGKNTLIIAPTGSGKTEAAILPILDVMVKEKSEPVTVFYITPLKALINDLYERITSEMNCILTPHISGVTTESNIRVSNFIVKKAIDFFK